MKKLMSLQIDMLNGCRYPCDNQIDLLNLCRYPCDLLNGCRYPFDNQIRKDCCWAGPDTPSWFSQGQMQMHAEALWELEAPPKY